MSGSRQYPPQNGQYAVRVKYGPDWKVFDTVRMEISVGQPYHEGEKLVCTLKWANDRFDKVALLVNDTLQRYNLMFDEGLIEKEAQSRTFRAGDEWIRRNIKPIVKSRASIFRWNDWLASPDYNKSETAVKNLYQTNLEFRNNIEHAISEVWDRRTLKDPDLMPRKEEFFENSRRYLLEETAVFSIIYKTIPGISAYPGSFHEMWAMFVDREVPGAPEGLKNSHCVRIDFRRNKKQSAPNQNAA
jgi:tRNA-dependent cyclodipeptide synthase